MSLSVTRSSTLLSKYSFPSAPVIPPNTTSFPLFPPRLSITAIDESRRAAGHGCASEQSSFNRAYVMEEAWNEPVKTSAESAVTPGDSWTSPPKIRRVDRPPRYLKEVAECPNRCPGKLQNPSPAQAPAASQLTTPSEYRLMSSNWQIPFAQFSVHKMLVSSLRTGTRASRWVMHLSKNTSQIPPVCEKHVSRFTFSAARDFPIRLIAASVAVFACVVVWAALAKAVLHPTVRHSSLTKSKYPLGSGIERTSVMRSPCSLFRAPLPTRFHVSVVSSH
mmetsp:Transcript_9490/g.18952  ORF Transcript_9490/g.18952 Transcript_9490/m.18952 type:complete len:277 (+) Transcript_9490:1223-2053(+)